MSTDDGGQRKKKSTWVGKAWCMMYEGARYKVLTEKRGALVHIHEHNRSALNGLDPILET